MRLCSCVCFLAFASSFTEVESSGNTVMSRGVLLISCSRLMFAQLREYRSGQNAMGAVAMNDFCCGVPRMVTTAEVGR